MLESIESRINKNSPNGCWIWTGGRTGAGYGAISIGRRVALAHRYVYEHLIGPILAQTLDHLCRVTLCVNPDHLEPVSMSENLRRGNGVTAKNARKTHCKYGHEFTPENTYTHKTKNGIGRACKMCHKRYKQEAKDRAAQVK